MTHVPILELNLGKRQPKIRNFPRCAAKGDCPAIATAVASFAAEVSHDLDSPFLPANFL